MSKCNVTTEQNWKVVELIDGGRGTVRHFNNVHHRRTFVEYRHWYYLQPMVKMIWVWTKSNFCAAKTVRYISYWLKYPPLPTQLSINPTPESLQRRNRNTWMARDFDDHFPAEESSPDSLCKSVTHLFYEQLGCLALNLRFWPRIEQLLSNYPAWDCRFIYFG